MPESEVSEGATMCLKSITRVIENPTLDELTGYKNVFILNDKIRPAYRKPEGSGEFDTEYSLPTNTWLQSVPNSVRTDNYETVYKTGFHIFTTQEDATNWGNASHVIQVKYRLVTYHGIENTYVISPDSKSLIKEASIHIAREMYIPWPQTPIEI